MFEGLVRQLLLGYLGRYVKDFQKEQLKITLWNEEVLLENVELNLEAFDYLQLPFALKQGSVGRLSIKIPWKKLGWDPIIIVLEDVFICASQRDDQEWSLDAVEQREFAGKKAKLAAAELAKLSRRVCDNQVGQSFISYITAKILDSIQVSIRDVHVLYRDIQRDSAHVLFGLQFSSLTIMKQNTIGSSSGRLRGGQVNKIVEILGLKFYCRMIKGDQYLRTIEGTEETKFWSSARFEDNSANYILAPFDVSVSLLVTRSGKLDIDSPQYSISAEITGLVMSLDEVQLQQILILWDYLCTCELREKYWRYRPCLIPILGKLKGWQITWWHYAQESVLSDVRKKLRKTSWRNLGKRLSVRRKYVNLYKAKLDFLRQEQPIDENVILELEQMEKESDIDDILNYRFAAENELKNFLLDSSNSCSTMSTTTTSVEKSQSDERSVGRPRGWLNWLSRGVLGAGGTDDSSQFSGVVSDDVIKDIYEATRFHAVPVSNGDSTANERIYLSAIKLSIHQLSATLRCMKLNQEIAEVTLHGVTIEGKRWGECATITAFINSGKMVYPCNEKGILLMKRRVSVEKMQDNENPSVSVQVDISSVDSEVELSVKVILQPLEVTCDSHFFLSFAEFYNVLKSFKFQHERVISSLNGIANIKARLFSKAEYVLSSRNRLIWDVSFTKSIINVPWTTVNAESRYLVFEIGAARFISKSNAGVLASDIDDQASTLRDLSNSRSTCDILKGFQLQNLYDHFEVKLNDIELKIVSPYHPQTLTLCEKFCSSITFASCIIPDESIMKQFVVYINASSLQAHFSPSIYGVSLGFIAHIIRLKSEFESVYLRVLDSYGQSASNILSSSINANLALANFVVNLENDGENSSVLVLTLQDIDIRYALVEVEELRICIKALKILTYSLRNERDSHILCSTENLYAASSHQDDIDVGPSNQRGSYVECRLSPDRCFCLHYKAIRNVNAADNRCTVWFNNADLHCYPYVFGLLVGFFDKISVYGTSGFAENSSPMLNDKIQKAVPCFGVQKFGFSNFSETGFSEYDSIPLDRFPFVTIHNSGSLTSLESSLVYPISEWRKYLYLREQKIRSPKFSTKKGSNIYHASPLESTSVLESHCSGSPGINDIFVTDLNLSGIRVHFHDSSCIIVTVALPISKSSISINRNCVTILCSIEGLTLSSSWWAQNCHGLLWGPSLPNLSSILNVSVGIGNTGSLNSQTDICIGIQHVCCFLPSEFLAVIIGYFSLPDWCPNANERHVIENPNYSDMESNSAIMYSFEVLDSTLISPVQSDDCQFLKLEIPQLYCSFISKNDAFNVLKHIPAECSVPTPKVAEKNQSLNIFGRDLSLLVQCKDRLDSLLDYQQMASRTLPLIAPFSADVWVTIPYESESSYASSPAFTCIMTRIIDCQLIAEDGHNFGEFEALMDVINQFSSIDKDSKGFTSDVLQFLQFKRGLKENSEISHIDSSNSYVELRCCVNSLLIKLYHSRNDSFSLEPVAKIDMQFLCSVSFINEIVSSLDFSFSSLALYSMLNSVTLARCSSTCPNSSVLYLHLSITAHGENELCVSLPSLDIWLQLFEWNEVINLLSSYTGKMAKTSGADASSKNLAFHQVRPAENSSVTVSQNAFQSPSKSTYFSLEHTKQITFILIGNSEEIGITFHIPVSSTEDAILKFRVAEGTEQMPQNVSSNIVEGKHGKFVRVCFHSIRSELSLNDEKVGVKLNFEKMSGAVGICEDKGVQSWPFFQIAKFCVDVEICNNQMELSHIKTVGQCDRLDVWLSHHVFYFCHGVDLKFPEAGSSQFICSNLDLDIQLKKVSLLLSDGRLSCNGPLLELRMRNLLLHVNVSGNNIEGSVKSGLQVNYNNIHKVLWEPFVEPSKFQLSINRRQEMNTLLNSSIVTDIFVESTEQLNLNLTESFIESVFRASEMIKDALGLIGPNDIPQCQRLLNYHSNENICAGQYAPYVVQNLTTLPLVYHVFQGVSNADELDASVMKDKNSLQPGSSIPIYIHETPEEQLSRYKPTHSSDRLSEKQSNHVAHHFITIQFDGTCVPSAPISMDLVGLTYFEVDLSKPANKMEVGKIGDDSIYGKNIEECRRTDENSGFVVPVVFDVSVQRYSKLVRLYSTVILLNATSAPLELRFDIPFGVSPKILDPIYPGQEFPLPLHLAEAGRLRWRPLGNTYLWSEAHNLSNILLRESRIGFLKSFVCYPSHPSSDPFRCCISVQDISLPSSNRPRKGSSLYAKDTVKQSVENRDPISNKLDKSKKRFIHQVTLSTPLLVKNYLPEAVSLTIESGGITRTTVLSEVETSFFHIDSSYDLGLLFCMHGYKPSSLKFARMETFSAMAKFSGTRFSLSEIVTFESDSRSGPMCVVVDKVMDAFSGFREVCIFVPFLLYNCTGIPLIISESSGETMGNICTIPSCYDLVEKESLEVIKDGLALLSSHENSHVRCQHNNSLKSSFTKSRIVSARNTDNPYSSKFLSKPLISSVSSTISLEQTNIHDSDGHKTSSINLKSRSKSSIQLNIKDSDIVKHEYGKVKPCMYSPKPNSSSNETMVKVSRCPAECFIDNLPNLSWSSPFFLVPPSGSTYVHVPQQSTSAVSIISVTSNAVTEPFSGKTKIITFQPRYVISNACSKDLCYKQKGTDFVFHLGVGQHSHLHWTDITRELVVSIRFNEPGWQWSGSFLPDHLGDTQVKIWNDVYSASNMIRIEVQNADVSIQDEKIVGNLHGNSGTNIILISDDNTGFMPYRIDNFSKERLRVYQQRCETFETIAHSYTSTPYAWDEPFYPHLLTVEVPGERVIGSYTLDDVKEYMPVYIPSNSEKPERTLLVSVHAEGATKVLSIIDSNYHVLKDAKDSRVPRYKEKGKHYQKEERCVNYREKLSVIIPYIGISLINCQPQELLFACAKNTTIDLLQNLDQQKISFQISCLQIDNQLHSTPYPVLLSFDREYRSNLANQMKINDESTKTKSENVTQIAYDSACEPVLCLAAGKWRNKDISLLSFEYISLRIADCRLELEQEVILSLFDFYRTVSSRFQIGKVPYEDSTLNSFYTNMDFLKESSTLAEAYEYLTAMRGQPLSPKTPMFTESHKSSPSLPSIVPIGAPWQRIYLLARRQKKIYVEVLYVAPIRLTLSFSSTPWKLRNGILTSGESLIHRGLMALADVEGAQISLKQLTISHHMASWESIQEILFRHYTRQLLHEIYKVFGSAGVIGNPMGFARSLGLGIKDFLSVPARSVFHSPTGLITGMAQGTTSLLSNTVYAISDAASQISRAAHKGIVAITFDDQAVAKMEKQQKGVASHGKGVINEVLEGLTGLLQSPIKGAEKHGLPGVLSGIAIGVTGLVAKPTASILEVTGKTAQSIRNRSKLYQKGSRHLRARLPRLLSRELPLRPYSWEEAVGTSVLVEFDDGLKLKDEVLVLCKALKQGGKFVVITEKLVLIVNCSSLVTMGKPEFQGIPADPEWVIEVEIGLESVIHADTDGAVVHIVGSSSETVLQKRDGGTRTKRWYNSPTPLPLFQTNMELACREDADNLLQILLSTIELGKEQGWGCGHLLHQTNLKLV